MAARVVTVAAVSRRARADRHEREQPSGDRDCADRGASYAPHLDPILTSAGG
jgi:hypothetical protein